MEVVEAGILDTLKETLNKLFGMFQKLVEKGMQIIDTDEGDDGETIVKLKTKDGRLFFIAQKEMKPNVFNIRIYDKAKTKQFQKKNLNVSDVPKYVANCLKEGWNVDINDTSKEDNTLNSTKKMKMTLKRVVGSKEDEIHLVGITGNYDVDEMQSNIDTLLSDEGFVETITEEPKTFEILDNGDDLDVQNCDDSCKIDYNTCAIAAANEIINESYTLLFDMQYIHWNAKGSDFQDIHSATDSMMWAIRDSIDTMSELISEYGGTARHPREIMDCFEVITADIPVAGKDCLEYIRERLDHYAKCLSFWSVNFTKDVQNIVLQWCRSAEGNANYFIKNKIVGDATGVVPINPSI